MPQYHRPEDVPERVPLFPLPRALLLPRAQLPLTIFEPRYLKMAEDALVGGRLIGMIQPFAGRPSLSAQRQAGASGFYPVGCLGRLTSFTEVDETRLMIVLTGLARFHLRMVDETAAPYRIAAIALENYAADMHPPRATDFPRKELLRVLRRYLQENNLAADWRAIERTPDEMLINSLSMLSPFAAAEKQALLEAPTITERCRTLITLTEIALAGGGEDVVQ